MKESFNIAVLGAGVVGLSTALSIQKSFPSFPVTIFADKFNEDTLSSGAGGIYRPEINVHPDSKRVRNWCLDSLHHFVSLLNSSESASAGIQLISGYQLSSTEAHPHSKLLDELLPLYREVDQNELELFPKQYRKGVFFTTVMADCRYYLKWMESKFKENGGRIEKKHLSNLNEVPEEYNLIVNCCGLEARNLLDDDQLMPVRGQTIRVKAPWIKHFYYGDEVYILPGVDYVTLGGVKDYGSWSLNVNKYQRQYILDKSIELVPSLKDAEIVKEWVGLRPFRPSIRVDTALVACGEKYRLVVNNYGHGGHGVALSWGTAQDVTRMIQKLLKKQNIHVSKL